MEDFDAGSPRSDFTLDLMWSPPSNRSVISPDWTPLAHDVNLPLPLSGQAEFDEQIEDSSEDQIATSGKLLEQRVAEYAKRRCTIDEVSALQREIQTWLDKDGARRPEREVCTERATSVVSHLDLNLPHKIIVYTGAAKGVKSKLEEQLAESETVKRRLETELHRQRAENYDLKREISKLVKFSSPPLTKPTLTPTLTPGLSTPRAWPPSMPIRSELTSPDPGMSHSPGEAAFSGYAHHTSSVTSPRASGVSSIADTPATLPSTDEPAISGQNQRWRPQMTREEYDLPSTLVYNLVQLALSGARSLFPVGAWSETVVVWNTAAARVDGWQLFMKMSPGTPIKTELPLQ
ncbi:hypothetical protein BKA62DRAFT_831985 [Auriculariales sp. MPI-PUGE-AT-0066]|nr:hypothetical protein BKA62DRAFT_831985 [Auriculariales sp. MPI-PUGE-AT-0066]